ncbi:cupin domain-containing protein [Rhizobium sp. L1K21]|uniref:cupin domain-containing protein n=1 Tax=Rhizobium sp. L1K21 TaxID=2954933 RepID=UPI002092EF8E|nr:cupin domain-containing protein [Rhizobium sp. L1K21]MCO6187671.1 cupin domain-containing protein [Rhizobium sp. L1K21]
MIAFENFGDLMKIDLGTFKPKPTTLTPGQEEAALALWESADGKMETGVWECTPGRFTADRTKASEMCHILSGRVTIHNSDGTSQDIGPGEMFSLPLGWTGEWTLHERTRKIYIFVTAG